MFGRKKRGEKQTEYVRRQAGESSRYYRQDDYYTQQPSGGSYYDPSLYMESYPGRRDYARPGYDMRFVNRPGDPQAQPGGAGNVGDGADEYSYDYAGPGEGYGEYRRETVPYMEEGYGERIIDPAALPEGTARRRRGADSYGQERGSRYDRGAYEQRGYDGRYYDGRTGNGAGRGQGPGGYGYGGYGEPPRRPKKKRRAWLIVLEVLLVLILAAGVFAFAQLGRIHHTKLGEVLLNSGIGSMSGYTNLVLYGVDSRTGELTKDCHSDTIMILSINRRTKEVKIASVYRDTYLDNTNGEFRKATECYFYGGPERSINMLNKNLDLNLKDYISVNFNAVVEVIDLLGGIDLQITDEEMNYINGYCVENQQVTGVSYTPLTTSGYVHLDGIQALAYCRIRYTEGWDFKRTERQRTVLTLAYQKATSQGPAALVSIANTMLPQIATSMSSVEILGLVAGIGGYKMGEQTGFPFDSAFADLAAGDCVVPVNLSANVSQLHAFLFGETGYTPSETVQEISYEITANTGIG